MNGLHHPYVRAAIDGEIARLASSQEGERNQTLFKATASLASLGLREGEILHYLKPAAEDAGLRGRELYTTVKSGVKAGHARPREIPESPRPVPSILSPATSRPAALPQRTAIDADGKRPTFIAGDGPEVSADELRRHVYRRNGSPVRMKIKRASGFVNWYRVSDGSTAGWQAGRPDQYVTCPYMGAVDPFASVSREAELYWPEGEKDCDTLGLNALPAFTFGGTGDGLPDGALEYLRGRHIVVLADNDRGGRDHAVRKAALAYSVAASVKVVEFPELPPKGDVTDYLKSASSDDLQRRVSAAHFWTPLPEPSGGRSRKGEWRGSVITARDLKQKNFAPVRYVVPGYIPEGVTVFAGKPKIGKSWLLYDICLACAADRFVLGTIKPTQGDVLYLALEDSQRRLKERLAKLCAGPWPERLTLTTEWRRGDNGGIEDIAEWCDEAADPLLVVIDTLERFRPPAQRSATAYTTDYAALTDLHKLAHARGIAIVVIHHVRKMEADDPFDMVSGTNGLTGAADTTLIIKRKGENVTLYARGRDIEEKETACLFNKSSCRWTLLGEAAEVQGSGQRSAVLEVLRSGYEAGMHISEIMAGIARSDRNAVDQLLFKMQRGGDIMRVKRGTYALPGKIGKKERNDSQVTPAKAETVNLTDLTHLTGDVANAG
jgi:hypothetical protein